MRACMSDEHKRQDARLNTNYKHLMSILDSSTKGELLKSQRLWVQFRDSNCQVAAMGESGTLGPVIIDSCFLDMTSSRADELEVFIKRASSTL